MRFVATGYNHRDMDYIDCGHFSIWELPPSRRTILGTCENEKGDLVSRRFFVPLPYTYMIVGYFRSESSGFVYGNFLGVGFRPTPITSTDQNIFIFPMNNNSSNGIVCLGDSWRASDSFATEEELAHKMIEAYFSSPFEGTDIFLLLEQEPSGLKPQLKNFFQWSEFKTFSEIKVDWNKLEVMFQVDYDVKNPYVILFV